LSIPFLSYEAEGTGFEAISPTMGLTEVANGLVTIRFLAFIERSEVLCTVFDSNEAKVEDRADYLRLQMPNDTSRYEDVITVAFPRDGRWLVKFFLGKDEEMFGYVPQYHFDVTGANPGTVVSPISVVDRSRGVIRHIPKPLQDLQLRFEAHEFARYSCPTGYFQMPFNIECGPNDVWPTCCSGQVGDRWGLAKWCQHIKLIDQEEEYRNYMFHAALPDVGLYELKICVQGRDSVVTYVMNEKANLPIPFLKYEIDDTGFIPILMTAELSQVDDGVAVIRFAAFVRSSPVFCHVIDSNDTNVVIELDMFA
jgi:hypothetical protein